MEGSEFGTKKKKESWIATLYLRSLVFGCDCGQCLATDWRRIRGSYLPSAQCSRDGLRICRSTDRDVAITENEWVHGSILFGVLYRLVIAVSMHLAE